MHQSQTNCKKAPCFCPEELVPPCAHCLRSSWCADKNTLKYGQGDPSLPGRLLPLGHDRKGSVVPVSPQILERVTDSAPIVWDWGRLRLSQGSSLVCHRRNPQRFSASPQCHSLLRAGPFSKPCGVPGLVLRADRGIAEGSDLHRERSRPW